MLYNFCVSWMLKPTQLTYTPPKNYIIYMGTKHFVSFSQYTQSLTWAFKQKRAEHFWSAELNI